MDPDARAREEIDRFLAAAGWQVCDSDQKLRQAILSKAFCGAAQ